jgi:hypothetical protein
MVVETVPDIPGDLSEPAAETAALEVAFDAPAFTTLHQAAHIWLSDQLAGDRWIREGFASLAAARVAAQMKVALPYAPEARTSELAEAAFPLISWGAGDSTIEQDAYAYAASWATAERLAQAVGDADLKLAWLRVAAGIGAYEPVQGDPSAPGDRPVTAVDSRRLLDQLEAVSGVDLRCEFVTCDGGPKRASIDVFDTSAELTARSSAREAYAALLASADGWGAPDPVVAELAGWRFDVAELSIAEALDWLVARGQLLAAIDAAGLTMPDRLRDRYRTAGGSADAQAELAAETAVVRGYVDVRELLADEPSIVKRIGLLGGREPSALLAEAATLFGEGDLRGAAEEIDAARARVDGAAADGLVRIVSAVAVLTVVLALILLVRRRRRATGYTARP